MNLQPARNLLWVTADVCQRIAELQDLCRALIEDAEKSDAIISELKAERARFVECDGECVFDTSYGEGPEAEEHPFKVWHRREET